MLLIRCAIFDHFNKKDLSFNNDQILEEIVKSGALGADFDAEKLEVHFEDLCKKEILRNIAQNLTTVWYKTFDPLSAYSCKSCNMQVYINADVEKNCPNPACNATISQN